MPKTGGTWVKSILTETGLAIGELGSVHSKGPDIINETEFQKRAISFTFVRHPLTWYQSYWSYKMKVQWNDPDNEFDRKVKSENFNDFLRNVISHFPGYLSGAFDRFTEGVTFVGKQERLVSDLLLVLTLAGETFDPMRIRSAKPINVASSDSSFRSQCKYSKKLADNIMEIESKAIALHGYAYLPQDIVDPSLKQKYLKWL